VEPRFFATPNELRAWFEANHASEDELVVGYYRKASGRGGITWQQSVDEALCFGWIDGIRRRVDDESYSNRFTPRRPRSNWSAINIARVRELIAEGRMTPAGLAAFEARADERSAIYSYEQRHKAMLSPEQEARLRADPAVWEWFQSRPPSWRRQAIYWVTSAKRPETQERRLAKLIERREPG
jgi:uncharacterized protein YdeI (YjbR/CyaY-like superfamily)